MDEQSISLRDTAKGVAIRASILGVSGVVVAGLIFSLGLKAAGALMKLLVGLFILSVFGGIGAWEVHKVKNRFSDGGSGPSLQADR